MDRDERRRQLGQFLRAHRERLKPDIATGRRRTPGLRREELAARAGIGATWITWLEQGREVGASPAALARLATALLLTPAERAFLFEMADRHDPDRPHATPAGEAPASIRALVDAMDHPAYGLDRLWNACAWNAPAARLFSGWLGGSEQNLLRYAFTDPSARLFLPDWEDRVARLLAEFRADYGRAVDDPRGRALITGLRAESPAFARAWDAQDVVAREGGPRAFLHPHDGSLAFHQHNFAPADRPDHKLVVLIPAALEEHQGIS